MRIADEHKKERILCQQFLEDRDAQAFLNKGYDEGYVLKELRTKILPDSQYKRVPRVAITIIMILDLPTMPNHPRLKRAA